MNKTKEKYPDGFIGFLRRAEQTTVVRAVRNGLVSMIPILILGAFALILKTFPVEGYQTFITKFAGGAIYKFFDIVYYATFGVLSVYMTILISRSYMKIKSDPEASVGGAIISAVASFFILAGAYLPNFSTENMGPKSMFLAILTGLGASALYLRFYRLFNKRKVLLFSTGADRDFNKMLTTIFPIVAVAGIFAIFNLLIVSISIEDSFRSFLIEIFNSIFSAIPDGFIKGFFFVFLSSVLWFFGIHGSDTLESVMQAHFAGGLEINKEVLASGGTPNVILTKQFFDCFVLMGGCGATICLLIAILIFSRNKARRGLGYTAAFPMIFNINELMIFGLPVIFNPVILIPFLLVPLVCYTTSYIAMAMELVPVVTNGIEWTTPVIAGGYFATGSYTGALLQIFNICLGVLIYLPFVILLDKQSAEIQKREFSSFMKFFREHEDELSKEKVTAMTNVYGDFAKSLCADIKAGLKTKIVLAYQPQYRYDGSCYGVEALLRYEHDIHGYIYPPLVIKLAEEGGFLADLEERVLKTVLEDVDSIRKRFGADAGISFNITGTTVVTPKFLQFCKSLKEDGRIEGANLCIEVTEQAALAFNNDSISALESLRGMGFALAIDDFSMGQTSINYLKDNLFDEIKLDGSLVKGLSTHKNCREIIQSITSLAATLNLTVLAEFVETEEEKEILHQIGCDCYQGYLYSSAVFLDDEE
ncbi:MAG: PTS sugar transporter subunit IIC/EAL domain-containing protein [Clostridia bacterium]|nr:PTS sugar transporter subunit IIC/EAL domain-containing protein [Clostridia bacterium]